MCSGMCLLAMLWLSGMPAPEVASEPADTARVVAAERARIETIRKIAPSVACVFPKGSQAGGGSGVIIDSDGYGLTNFHVVAMMLKDRAGEVGLTDGKLHDMEVLGIDPGGDVAMFKISEKDVLAVAPLGDASSLRVGDYTLAMGNPFGLADDYAPTVTHGIISGLHRFQPGVKGALVYTDCIQVDTSINPGNSGGPLFDMTGRLIGINGRISIEERSRVNVGVGFAITINQIRRFIPMLRAGLPAPHASAGFTVGDETEGVIVDQIDDKGPAYRAGLRSGDRLVQVAGVGIHSANHFLSELGVYPGGWPVEVAYEREGQVQRFRIRLDALPLPKMFGSGGPRDAEKPKFDPYGPHPVTTRANRRAVRRAFEMFHESVGGESALAGFGEVVAKGLRRKTGAVEEPPAPVTWSLASPVEGAAELDLKASADAIEQAVVAALLRPADRPDRLGYRVVGADEIRGRIAVVLQRRLDEGGYRVSLDDENGRLLAIEFMHAATNVAVRYEYGEERPAGPFRLPHARWLYHDDVLKAEDRFETMSVTGKAS